MPVRVTINGEGLSFTIDTDLSKAGAVISLLTDPNPPTVSRDTAPAAAAGVREYKTPRQTVVDLGAKTNPEKIASFMRYSLEKEDRQLMSVKEL
jgi:hypothetical protein